MAFDKDAFLTALDSMTVMELNDLVKAFTRSLSSMTVMLSSAVKNASLSNAILIS